MDEDDDIPAIEHPDDRPSNAPRYIGLALGLAGLCAVVVAGVFGAQHFETAIRSLVGHAPHVVTLDRAGVEAELARLSALPDGELPADLGAVAEARVACATQLLADRVSAPARAAAGRFFVVQLATERQVASPLIDPALLDAAGGDAGERAELRRLLVAGTAGKGGDEGLAEAVRAYRAISHPLYLGLGLEGTAWAQADLERILLAAGAGPDALGDCTRARVGG
jgi:hypothetical protein